MKFLKNIKSVELQLQNLPKLYRSHIWITPPADDGLSYLGISHYSKLQFVRFNKIDYEQFPKTQYSIANRQRINVFIEETNEKRKKGQLALSQQMEWQRFYYKQGQVFTCLQTMQFDLHLQAPIDMRVVQINYEVWYSTFILTSPFLFRVQALEPSQLELLDSEQKYLKSNKMIL